MKHLSIFDILGPIMVGPSSSHTAGALKISALVNKMANSKITSVEFTLYGSFAKTYKGHGTDKALVSGILGFSTSDIRIKNSLDIAKNDNLKVSFIADTQTKTLHPNTVLVKAVTQNGQKIEVLGQSVGGGAIKIININGIDVNFTGEYNTILIEQNDEKGVIADITRILNEHSVNIAFMRVFRHAKGGTAFTVIETDEEVTISNELLLCKNVKDVSILRI